MSVFGQCRKNSVQSNAAEKFVQYYKSIGYDAIPGSSLLDPAVPMAFVMSAGLAQVESSVKALNRKNSKRYTLIQNCFRYFDLRNIGKSPYHLSLFKMPGAFTFGFHSKKADILQTFRLLTDVYDFSTQMLWVTYFSGDVIEGIELPEDNESFNAWCEAGIPFNQIIGLGAEHNFWKQNANFVGKNHAAKCGPNTEVFFDRGKNLKCGPGCKPPCSCGRFREITNTLCITLNIDELNRAVVPLSDPFTETVIGAERIAMIIEDVSSVFDIASIKPVVTVIKEQAIGNSNKSRQEICKHSSIIADHIRAIVFLIADGAPPPGKGGRARLMRKLIREMLTSQKLIGLKNKYIMKFLVDVVIDLYSIDHVSIVNQREKVLKYLIYEAACFDKTVNRGVQQLHRLLTKKSNKKFSGKEILLLEKKHGFPIPLIERQLEKMSIQFDSHEYLSAHHRWKSKLSRSS